MNAVEHSPIGDEPLIASARRTLGIEVAGISALRSGLDADFARACRLCLACSGGSS